VSEALLELMVFDGSELYVAKDLDPVMTGVSFHLLQSVYPKAVPVGIRRTGGKLMLKPHPDTKVEDGEDDEQRGWLIVGPLSALKLLHPFLSYMLFHKAMNRGSATY
jgi:hypothetical protein